MTLARRIPLARSRRPIGTSKKRKDEMPERQEVRARVLKRDQGCMADGVIAHLDCAGPLDVHELVNRSQWRAGYLEEDNCIAICRAHHEWVTTHPMLAAQLGFHRWSWER